MSKSAPLAAAPAPSAFYKSGGTRLKTAMSKKWSARKKIHLNNKRFLFDSKSIQAKKKLKIWLEFFPKILPKNGYVQEMVGPKKISP